MGLQGALSFPLIRALQGAPGCNWQKSAEMLTDSLRRTSHGKALNGPEACFLMIRATASRAACAYCGPVDRISLCDFAVCIALHPWDRPLCTSGSEQGEIHGLGPSSGQDWLKSWGGQSTTADCTASLRFVYGVPWHYGVTKLFSCGVIMAESRQTL